MEKAHLPSPAEHSSYRKHRRELWTQILAPLLIAVAVILAVAALTGIATFRDDGDVARWAAISTIWIVIPWMIAGLVFLIICVGIVYGMGRLIKVIPPYTGQAQRAIWRAQAAIQRVADMIVKPILGVEGFLATLRRFFGIK